MSIRIKRINSEMQKHIMEIIRTRLNNPKISGMISVLGVSVAKDLKTAKVTVSITGDADETFAALVESRGFIKRELSQVFKDLRTTPDLVFILDRSMEYSLKISKILDEINAGLGKDEDYLSDDDEVEIED
ncbi:MAG: 30S ribosome-binding factor RbfA [Firmicutes bacterium]|nr:30S ribosome-binding factor RbfA [Bacillota bacterium]